MYLMAVVIATFYLRPLVPYKAWRLIHYGTFAVFTMALAHGIGAGTDSDTAWASLIYVLGGSTVVGLLLARLRRGLLVGGMPRVGQRRAGAHAPPAVD